MQGALNKLTEYKRRGFTAPAVTAWGCVEALALILKCNIQT